MPPARRPVRPREEAPRRKPSLALLGGIGAAAVGVIAVIFVALGGGGKSEEAAPPPPPRKVEIEYALRVHHLDSGWRRQLTILVQAKAAKRPEDFVLVDNAGKEHAAAKVDGRDLFLPEIQADPGALPIQFSVPPETSTCDLRVPGGRLLPAFRAAPAAPRPLPASVLGDDWAFEAKGGFADAATLDLELRATPSRAGVEPFDPKTFRLLTDRGEAALPEVKGQGLRYAVPKDAREVRFQLTFRTLTPDYLVLPVAGAPPPGPKPEAATPKPELPKPPAPAGSLRAQFDAKRSDPVGALVWLASQPPSDESRALARETVAKVIQEDLAAGLKAFEGGKAAEAERPLVRAALLADPYQPDLSRQLMRMLFLLKQPRKAPTSCTACGGAGSSACGGCQAGHVTGACPRCEARGSVACLLCDGSGRQDHTGYKGQVAFTCGRFKFPYQGKTATMDPQTITWQLSPCNAGAFHVSFESVHAESGKKTPGARRLQCGEMWGEFKTFIFSGKAKIKVPNRKGQLVPISSSAAKRFFADYEHCKGGNVPCDRCEGRMKDPCSTCAGSGKAPVLCGTCEGTTLKACGTCKGYGDSAWLAKLLPAAPALSQSLGENAVAVRDWLDERSRARARKDDLARRLAEARKGLDPSAKLGDDLLDIACPRCKGAGGECIDCWATGRREYFAGTAPYERYALAKRLERQAQESGKPSPAPALAALSSAETPGAPAAMKPVAIPIPPRPSGGPLVVPKNIDEIIKKADQLHETGRTHLEKAKTTQDQAVWMDEAVKALDDLKNAQTLYATAQEKLDEAGAAVPAELLKKFRTNMQALVIARRTAP